MLHGSLGVSCNDNEPPIRRIPREILGLFFTQAFNDDHTCIPTISQVCSLWREVALSFSVFWANIDVDLTKEKSTSKAFLESVDLQLERSENTLLEVKLVMDRHFEVLASHPALDKILETSNRWITAILTVSGGSIPLLNKLNGQLANLRTLVLRSILEFDMMGLTYRMFERAPSLCEVRIDFPRDQAPPHVSLPWPQLIIYEESVDNSAKHIHLMTSCRTLRVTWNWMPFSPAPNLPTGAGPILMENLRVFHFRDYSSNRELLSRLRSPNLSELHVSSGSWKTLAPYLVSMLRDPPSLLQNLQIHQAPASPSSLVIDVLRLTPCLKKLDLWIPAFDFDVLASYLSHHDSLPQLQKLILCSSTPSFDSQDPDNCILKIVSSRCEQSTQHIQRARDESDWVPPPPVVLSLFWTDGRCDDSEELEVLNRKHRPSDLAQCLLDRKVLRLLFQCSKILNIFLEEPIPHAMYLDKLFSCLMELEIGVEYFYRTRIHHELDAFIKQALSIEIYTHSDYDFPRRAQEVLQKWNNALILDLPNRRWVKKGETSFVYSLAIMGCAPPTLFKLYMDCRMSFNTQSFNHEILTQRSLKKLNVLSFLSGRLERTLGLVYFCLPCVLDCISC